MEEPIDDLDEWEREWDKKWEHEHRKTELTPEQEAEIRNTGMMIFSAIIIVVGVIAIFYADQMATTFAFKAGLANAIGMDYHNPYNDIRMFGFIAAFIGVIMFYRSET